ncbi:MAG TPA: PilZ domain-containing protein [Terracidiphilus sp.]|nr:PilZ domain-containing protein [Terracidiphilus sp.]
MEAKENTPGLPSHLVIGNLVSRLPEPQNGCQNRRIHSRCSVDDIATLRLIEHGFSLQCRILNVCLEGCCLSAPEPLTAGKRARVEVTFKVNGISFRFLGSVQWADGNRQVGIRFADMIARRREQLAEVIAEIEAAEKAKMEKAAADVDTAEKETQDKKEPAGQLSENQKKSADKLHGTQTPPPAATKAHKQQIDGQASTAAHANGLSSIPQQPSVSNRRAHVRFEVNSIATILLVKVGSRLKGSIVDLSEGGCRIRCDERFPVGIYTRVETEFRFENLPFLLGGVVQVIHNQREVGIRFLDMSDRKRQQLRDLVEEIRSMRNSSESALPD